MAFLFYFKSFVFEAFRLSGAHALPALFGDDHLGLMPVELQPQRPVAQIHLRPDSGCGSRQRHGADAGARPRVRGVQTAGALAELVTAAPELAAAGAHRRRGEARGRQDGSVVERSRVPGAAGARVHRARLSCIGEEGTGTGHVGTGLGRRQEVSVRAQFVYVVPPPARQLVLTQHRGVFPPIGHRFGESVPRLPEHPVPHRAQVFLWGATGL